MQNECTNIYFRRRKIHEGVSRLYFIDDAWCYMVSVLRCKQWKAHSGPYHTIPYQYQSKYEKHLNTFSKLPITTFPISCTKSIRTRIAYSMLAHGPFPVGIEIVSMWFDLDESSLVSNQKLGPIFDSFGSLFGMYSIRYFYTFYPVNRLLFVAVFVQYMRVYECVRVSLSLY